MSRQDKATTDRFTKTLRELVKRPENKLCADCKRNDPRWASWNLGVFLCIRCSGIHRGMGTHISKVKSVDLDTWTPEQMQSIQKWGNRLANLYWEAHLKPGHVPPEHKMESFIRSKYESRRWALDGPPPPDPSILESDAGGAENPVEPAPAPPFAAAPDPIGWGYPSAPRASSPAVSRQPQPHQLISPGHTNLRSASGAASLVQPRAQVPPPTGQPKVVQPKPVEDLLSLDFHAPAAPASPPPSKNTNAKQDILSLFAAPAPAMSPQFGQLPQQQQTSPWGAPVQPVQPVQPQSMAGTNGTGMWGASSGWAAAPQLPQQQNLWGAPAVQQQSALAQHQSGFTAADSGNVWGGMASAPAPTAGGTDMFSAFSTPFGGVQPAQQKKDDAFGDLWGGFK
ncbi:hypothetical protein B0H15DRAFT_898959 [Mycena belliarum]|uniref:Arf-GAP domain-containing protein n=1 Tax=Mycena belliarum TaxID=1033014 RepID=A0AAD6UIS0_9AGAR|nr:hypothetical protein B0H15DRAFT_898959 [Mycena belliae]